MSDSSQSGARSLLVLVVDDDRDTADSLAEILTLCGHHTRTAYNGATAVEEAAAFRPEVVFLDLTMPCMDGFGAAPWIRAQVPHAVLVAVTGSTGSAVAAKCGTTGFDYLLTKPLDMNALEGVIQLAAARVVGLNAVAWASAR